MRVGRRDESRRRARWPEVEEAAGARSRTTSRRTPSRTSSRGSPTASPALPHGVSTLPPSFPPLAPVHVSPSLGSSSPLRPQSFPGVRLYFLWEVLLAMPTPTPTPARCRPVAVSRVVFGVWVGFVAAAVVGELNPASSFWIARRRGTARPDLPGPFSPAPISDIPKTKQKKSGLPFRFVHPVLSLFIY